jgi:hypothetical protein
LTVDPSPSCAMVISYGSISQLELLTYSLMMPSSKPDVLVGLRFLRATPVAF